MCLRTIYVCPDCSRRAGGLVACPDKLTTGRCPGGTCEVERLRLCSSCRATRDRDSENKQRGKK
jgi:hypothetical protein